MGGWWAQVGASSHPFLVAGTALLLALAAVGSMAIVASVRRVRRLAPWVVLLAWLAVGGTWWLTAASSSADASQAVPAIASCLGLATTAFWLVDRGIPGNRPRPPWFRAYAVGLVGLALAAIVLAIRAGG